MLNGRNQNIGSYMPAHQAKEHNHIGSFGSQTLENVPSGLFSTSGGRKFQSTVRPNGYQKVKQVVLQAGIQETGGSSAVNLAPMALWFDNLRCVDQNGAGTTIFNRTGEQMLVDIASNLEKGKEDVTLARMNLGTGREAYWERPIDSHPAGATRYYSIPLYGIWNHGGLVTKNMENWLFEISGRPSIIVEGSGTISCVEIKILFETEKLSEQDSIYHSKLSMDSAFSYNFLEPVQMELSNQTLTASTKYQTSLSTLNGKCAFLAVLLRTSLSNTDNGYYNWLTLGQPDQPATCDVSLNNTGLLGSGAPVDISYLRSQYPDHFNNGFFNYKHALVIPFCESIRKAYAGVVDGYLNFDGQDFKLEITPSAAGTAPVVTSDVSSAGGDGFGVVSFQGYQTEPIAYDATASTVQTAVNRLPSIRNFCGQRATVASSGVFLTADRTLTLSNARQLVPYGHFKVEALSQNAGVNIATTSTLTTAGQAGWTTGSSYYVTILAYMHKRATVLRGKVVVENL